MTGNLGGSAGNNRQRSSDMLCRISIIDPQQRGNPEFKKCAK